jgi:ribonuclease P protein component
VLAAEFRLRRRDEFAAVVKTGRRAGRGSVVVHVLPSAPTSDDVLPTDRELGRGTAEAPVRVGFVIPRAVGNAVARNQVRRRLRHLARERMTGLPAGTDVVVRASAGAAACTYEQLGTDLVAAMNAAHASAIRAGRKARSIT